MPPDPRPMAALAEISTAGIGFPCSSTTMPL
jgi:hypothetical protein